MQIGFHSIDFPSEWGRAGVKEYVGDGIKVSIQLISPASGDTLRDEAKTEIDKIIQFPFN